MSLTLTLKPQLKCPKCGSTECSKAGFDRTQETSRQRYRCKKCKREFIDPSLKVKRVIRRKSGPKPAIIKGVKCPKCGSDKIRKFGFQTNLAGKVRKYQCKQCKRSFLERYSPILGKKRGRPSESGSFPDIPNLKFLFRKKVTVDSIVGVPCACCSSNTICDPRTCAKLDNWLGLDTNIPIEEAKKKPQADFAPFTRDERELIKLRREVT